MLYQKALGCQHYSGSAAEILVAVHLSTFRVDHWTPDYLGRSLYFWSSKLSRTKVPNATVLSVYLSRCRTAATSNASHTTSIKVQLSLTLRNIECPMFLQRKAGREILKASAPHKGVSK
jgi:hypothetical protein